MHFILLTLLLFFNGIYSNDNLEKYRSLREKCSRSPSNSECLKLKSKFLELIQKCQKLNTQQQITICQEVKAKLCAVFPSNCTQTTTILSTKRRTQPKPKLPTTAKVTTNETMNNEEFVKVPINPKEFRTRGEYCIRHSKEKKCRELLNNLKKKYSSCNQKKTQQIDCHSFQTHLCKAFTKFPPCIKKISKEN